VLGIPTEVMPMVRSSLFGVDAKLRMALEPLVPKRVFASEADDESVGAFIARRFGDELAERLVAPLLGGIFAGDADQISVRAAFPQLVAAEAKYGSLVRAMMAARRERAASDDGTSAAGSSTFLSLVDGMGSLVDALDKSLRASGVSIRTGAAV